MVTPTLEPSAPEAGAEQGAGEHGGGERAVGAGAAGSGGGPRRTGSTVVKTVVVVVALWLAIAPLATISALVVAGIGLTALARQQVNCSVAGTATQVQGVQLDAEQLANAQLIVSTVAGLGNPPRAAQIAVATALQESSLRNLDHGDAAGPDSLGLFQQRASYGPHRGDPVEATTMFVQRLVAVPGWQTMPLTQAAADVQRPRADLEGEYARWESVAHDLVTRYWPTTSQTGGGAGGGAGGEVGGGVGGALLAPGQADPPSPTAWSVLNGRACIGADGEGLADPPGAADGQPLPPGWTPVGSAAASTAIQWALAQRGKPYLWGGVGPDGFDCSGLMMKAWAAAGVAIPRTTIGQRTTGVAVGGVSQLQPGDLLFIAGSEGTATAPRHVGMFIGEVNGVPSFVQAPRTGDVVQVDPLSRWSGDIVAIRRPVTP